MNTFVFLALCGAAFEAGCGDVTERLLQQQAPIRPSVCYQPKDTGPCSGHFPRFYYNTTTNTCQQFVFGGCKGNANHFLTLEGCESKCGNASLTDQLIRSKFITKLAVLDPVCELPKKVGPCRGHIPRYYYNTTTDTCEEFVYGGCQGNANNFPTLNQCETKCGGNYTVEDQSWKKHIMKPVALEDVIRDNPVLSREAVEVYPGCDEPKYPGPCAGHFPRYYFNNASKNCEQFVFGGCQANGNNFESVDECMNRCWVRAYQPTQKIVSAVEVPFWPVAPPEVCTYPADVGPCKAYMPRFFFNTLTTTCEQFVYGGCGGNANNFFTYDACQKKCMTVLDVIPRA